MKQFKKRSIWIKTIGLTVGLVIVLALVWPRPQVTHAVTPTIHLTPFGAATDFNQPIGIDFYEPTNQLIASANYPDGDPNNLDLIDSTGHHTPYSSLAFMENELKLAAVHSGPCVQAGFTVGDVFTGSGTAGQIIKVPSGGGAPVIFATLGDTALIRGSLYVDRTCIFNGDLIVVTGNEQTDANGNDGGRVWRVNHLGNATLIATLPTAGQTIHLEGVIVVPNDPKYGPAAGRILAGAEDLIVEPNHDNDHYGTNGRLYSIGADGSVFTIGASDGVAGRTNYPTASAVHPEDVDIVRKNAAFFGVDYGDGMILTAASANFDSFCGDILLTQEFPSGIRSLVAPGVSGLSILQWNGTAFVVTALPLDASSSPQAIRQWEHVTFLNGTDCNVCIPANFAFNLGQAQPFSVLYLTGANAITGGDSTINGNVGIAANVTGSLIKLQVNGNLVKDPNFDDSIIASNFKVSGTTTVASLTGAVNDALAANAAFCAASPTQPSPGAIPDGNTTITLLSAGLNVVAIPSVNTHGVITINGPAGSAVVFNVAGGFTCNGCTINGSVPAQNILWNFCGTGADVSISKPVGSTRGIFLAPDRNILLDKATNIGALIGARNGLKLLIHSAATLTSPCP